MIRILSSSLINEKKKNIFYLDLPSSKSQVKKLKKNSTSIINLLSAAMMIWNNGISPQYTTPDLYYKTCPNNVVACCFFFTLKSSLSSSGNVLYIS